MTDPPLRQHALRIFQAALAAVEPEATLRAALDRSTALLDEWQTEASGQGRLFLLAVGKAAAPMARAAEIHFGERLDAGLVITKDGHGLPLERSRLVQASHPVPDHRGIAAAKQALTLVTSAGKDDLVLCLISGGASALLPAPVADLSLAEKQRATDLLLASGADIGAMNVLRKHLSTLKGGGLARHAMPARLQAFLISDVIGNDLATIGSGLTAPDPSSFADAWKIVTELSLQDSLPPGVIKYLQQGREGLKPETVKPGDTCWLRVDNSLVASIDSAAVAAGRAAEALGYRSLILATDQVGEASRAAVDFVALATRKNIRKPTCLVLGGETTVTLKGQGRGGRNQEFALAAVRPLASLPGAVLLAGGTDGTDGPTNAAGGLIDSGSLKRAEKLGLQPESYLADNDSYAFLQKTGDLLVTGPTRTNVMDLSLLLLPGNP